MGKKLRNHIKLAVLAALLSVVAAACFAPPSDPPDPPAAPSQAYSAEELFVLYAPSVCEIRVGAGNSAEAGTGFLAKTAAYADGRTLYIATNHHVVKSFVEYAGTRVSIRFYRDDSDVYENAVEKTEITLCGYDEYHDIAVLKVSDKRPQKERKELLPFPGSVHENPPAGRELLALGNMGGDGIQIFDGLLSDPEKVLEFDGFSAADPLRFRPVYQVTVDLNAGVSGGPVFDKAGRLVGIAAYQMPVKDGRPVVGVSFAVPAVIAAPLIEKAVLADDGGKIHKLDIYMDGASSLYCAELGFYVSKTDVFYNAADSSLTPYTAYAVSRLVAPSAPPPDLKNGEWFNANDRIVAVASLPAHNLSWAQLFGVLCGYANASKDVPDALKNLYSGEELFFTVARGGEEKVVAYTDKKALAFPGAAGDAGSGEKDI